LAAVGKEPQKPRTEHLFPIQNRVQGFRQLGFLLQCSERLKIRDSSRHPGNLSLQCTAEPGLRW
jgi:hypothetical protein